MKLQVELTKEQFIKIADYVDKDREWAHGLGEIFNEDTVEAINDNVIWDTKIHMMSENIKNEMIRLGNENKINVVELKTLDEFLKLKDGDAIIVEWDDYFVKHHENSTNMMCYTIADAKHRCDEIICRSPENHYFNYKMHLGLDTPGTNTSRAIKVYKVFGDN